MDKLFTLTNPVFRTYALCSSILVLKMMFMSLLTAKQRFRKGVFANPEDIQLDTKAKIRTDDIDVERVRRAHLNDLENIPLFYVTAFFYLITNPNAIIAISLMWLYTIARFIFTFVYAIFVIPQPTRFILCLIGYGITGYMAITSVLAFWFL